MRIGIHTSKSGSFERAALKAHELGANCFQIFTTSPRIWRSGTPDPADVKCLQTARKKFDLTPLVVHNSYLVNLASCNPAIRSSSIAAFRSEVERCLTIGADCLVFHPGNHKDRTVEQGLCAIIEALEEATRGLKSRKLHLLFENTVGAGGQLGSRFEELRALREVAQPRVEFPLGFCLDTCHCFASGRYNMATPEGLKHTVNEIETILGLQHVKVIHTNDSKGAFGSRLDRHANIGEGCIGLEGFRRILNHPKLKSKAFILETPVDNPGDDRKNVNTLLSLVGKPS